MGQRAEHRMLALRVQALERELEALKAQVAALIAAVFPDGMPEAEAEEAEAEEAEAEEAEAEEADGPDDADTGEA